jgi:hypothetical protein
MEKRVRQRGYWAIAIAALRPAGLALVMSSCATTPVTKATETEKLQCEPTTLQGGEIAKHLSVLSVSPNYIRIHSSTMGEEVRTAGAKLLVRPPEAMDANRLLRALQCHAARVALGQESPIQPNDPFTLPGSWLEIEVESEVGNYAITIAADSIPHGLSVLAEAQGFARDHAAPSP